MGNFQFGLQIHLVVPCSSHLPRCPHLSWLSVENPPGARVPLLHGRPPSRWGWPTESRSTSGENKWKTAKTVRKGTLLGIFCVFFSFFFIIFCTSMVGNRWLYQMIPTCDGWPCQAKTLPVVMDAQRNSLVSSLGCVWKCGASNGYSNFKHGDKPYYTLPNFWDPVENFLNFWQTSILWVIYFCQHLLSISCTENLQAGLHWLQVLARSQNMTCCCCCCRCCCCCCCCCQKIARHVSWGCSAGVPSLQSETNWAPCRLRNPICQPRQLLLVLAPCLEVGGFENTVTVAGRTFGLSRGWVFEDFGAEHDLFQDCHINPSREPT